MRAMTVGQGTFQMRATKEVLKESATKELLKESELNDAGSPQPGDLSSHSQHCGMAPVASLATKTQGSSHSA